MWYKIIPNDTLFFRDGKPFSMGSETWAEGIFPPYPSTVYGAIRSWLIFEKGTLKDFKEGKLKELGTQHDKGNLKIKGPILMKEEPLFICPLDLVKVKEDKKNKLFLLQTIKKTKIFISDYPLENLLLWQRKELVDEADGFLTLSYLIEYLKGINEVRLTNKEELLNLELKIGIARERKTLAAKDGHLYRVPMIRLKETVSFVVKIEGINDIPKKGIIQLGGEGKTARIEKVVNSTIENLEKIDFEITNKIFKIYLATPAIFKKGWLPKWIDEKSFEGKYQGIDLKLIGACIGKYKHIGGWDLAKNQPKPMRRAVPAGSVYYFKILDDSDVQKIKDVFYFKNISDILSEEGFGLSFVGGIKL